MNHQDRTQDHRVLDDLSRRFDELTGSQKRIVEYIVRNPDKAAFMNLEKLADAIAVSPSTIVRLCYRLDYDGFTDMQSQLQEWLRGQLNQDRSQEGEEVVEEPSLVHESLEAELRNLHETKRMLRKESLDQAVHYITTARKIRVVGLRSAYGVAHSLTVGLQKILGNVTLLHDTDGTLPEAVMEMTDQDLLIATTFPRYSPMTVDVARYVSERGANVIALTDSVISPLARVASVVLPCAYQGMGVQNSLASAMAVAYGLVLSVEAACREEYHERIKETERLTSRWNLILLRRRDEFPDE